jgi:hypothetical protein
MSTTNFVIFDAQLQSGKPDSWSLNLQKCDTLYQGALYASGNEPSGGGNDPSGGGRLPLKSHVQALVAATTNNLLNIDIEDPTFVNADYLAVLSWCRAIRPSVQLGWYGIAPILSANVGVLFGISDSNYTAWQAINDSYAPVIAALDFLAPVCYIVQSGIAIDKTIVNTSANLVEARRIGKGKPVYPWIWPQYAPNFTGNGTFASQTDWARMLALLYTGDVTGTALGSFWDASWQSTGCDGAILWNDLGTWDSTKPWLAAQAVFNAANTYRVGGIK